MRSYVIVLIFLAALLLICIIRTYNSSKKIALTVRKLLLFILVPVISNIIIVITQSYTVSMAAYSCYLIGTDIMLYILIEFCMEYCSYKFKHSIVQFALKLFVVLDTISILLNPILGHCFDVQLTELGNGYLYNKLIPSTFHEIHFYSSYVIIVIAFFILIDKIRKSSKLYIENYYLMLISMFIAAIWEFYYVFYKIPYDTSMIGYTICGVLFYFFSLEYVPFILTDRLQANIVNNISDSVIFLDENDVCIYANKNALKLFDADRRNLDTIPAKFEAIINTGEIDTNDNYHCTSKMTVGNETKILRIEFQRIFDRKSLYVGAFAKIEDRTAEEEKLAKERYLSTHDRITGLYNAAYFSQKVQEELDNNPDEAYYAIFSDIRNFKILNDMFGREIGDDLLIQIADHIRNSINDPSTIYGRLGADHFGILIKERFFKDEYFSVTPSTISHVVNNVSYPAVIHIGIYKVSPGEQRPDAYVIFDRASMAVDSIKDNLQKRVAYYDDKMRNDLMWKQDISRSLDESLRTGRIIPYLHAQVDTEGHVKGAEVLVRWNHPEKGLLSPETFTHVLEKNGYIVKLDQYIWESACAILYRWKLEGKKDMYLSVNISPIDFYFLDIYDEFTSLVKRYDIDPKNLKLEITETVVIANLDQRLAIIDKLRAVGFIIEMDDFGSGYSSLNLLKDLPIDVMKIDMVFLSQTGNAQRGRMILGQIIKMAKELDISVIAEGVETQEQVRFLTDAKCDMLQGYYFDKPTTVSDFENKYF